MPRLQSILISISLMWLPVVVTVSCDTAADATAAARDAFSAVWDFLSSRNLTANMVIFGETRSNSTSYCNGYPDATLTLQSISGYLQSQLYSSGGSVGTAGPYAPNVVFRPWGNAAVSGSICETPLNIGAPAGPFKY